MLVGCIAVLLESFAEEHIEFEFRVLKLYTGYVIFI
jgi:hypothetical protein